MPREDIAADGGITLDRTGNTGPRLPAPLSPPALTVQQAAAARALERSKRRLGAGIVVFLLLGGIWTSRLSLTDLATAPAALALLVGLLVPWVVLEYGAAALSFAPKATQVRDSDRAARVADGFLLDWLLGHGFVCIGLSVLAFHLEPGAVRLYIGGVLALQLTLFATGGIGLVSLIRRYRAWHQTQPITVAAYTQALRWAQDYPAIEAFRQALRACGREHLTHGEWALLQAHVERQTLALQAFEQQRVAREFVHAPPLS